LRPEDQDIVDFQLSIFTEFTSGGFDNEAIDFALPRETYPLSCVNSAEFDILKKLVDDTTQAKTYLKWLGGRLDTACDGTFSDFTGILE